MTVLSRSKKAAARSSPATGNSGSSGRVRVLRPRAVQCLGLRRLARGLGRGLACEHAPCGGGAPTGGEPSECGHVASIASLFGTSRPPDAWRERCSDRRVNRAIRRARHRGRVYARAGENGRMSPVLRRTKKKAGERMVTLIGKPGCHLCEEAREVVDRGVRRDRCAPGRRRTSRRTRSCTGCTGSRFRSCWSTASSTPSGGWIPDGCAAGRSECQRCTAGACRRVLIRTRGQGISSGLGGVS